MNKVDILFIVDVTGSMGSFIHAAKQKMREILKSLSEKFEVDVNVGLSLYRDHPSQGDEFVTATFKLSSIDDIQKNIDKISVDGGGDVPEAVIDGIIDGISDMKWRDGRRIAFLIGDAPAHGMVVNEQCCQCGKTWGGAVSVAQKNRVSVYSLLLGNDSRAASNFKTIANFTGGILISTDDAMSAILETLSTEFDNVNLDAKVLEMLSKNMDSDDICKMLDIDRDEFGLSASRITQHTL